MSRSNPAAGRVRNREHGMSILWVAGGLVFILGVAALTIDLASLYVVRNEAQRASDAGALAGAKAFVDSGCLSGGAGACDSFHALATTRATSAAGQNSVGGVSVSSLPGACVSVTFPTSTTGDQLVSVTIQRTTACGNAIPTLFAKVLGFFSADVSAIATAEAYNPHAGGGSTGPSVCYSCIKPFLVPNCDPIHTSPANPNCSGNGYFVDPGTGAIEHPGPAPGGVVGQTWLLHQVAAPSQWNLVDVGCGNGDQSPCITACTSSLYACGNQLNTVPGKRVGQIDSVNTLIHAGGDGPTIQGQDTIAMSGSPAAPVITGGTSNPYGLSGKTITSSDSLITVAVYNGAALGSGKNTVTIVGYMQMFVQYVQHNGPSDDITAVILGVSGCGTGSATCGSVGDGGSGSGSGGTVGGGGSLFVIRLVRTPGS